MAGRNYQSIPILEVVRRILHMKHYSDRTEEAYLFWIKRVKFRAAIAQQSKHLHASTCAASSTVGNLVASDQNRLEARSLTPQQAS